VNDLSKRALREAAAAARRLLPAEERAASSVAIQERLVALPIFLRAATVGLYAPIGAEVDTAAIARAALRQGKELAFPRLAPDRPGLDFAACSPEELVPAALGTREPPPDATPVAGAALDLLLVPGVAFDLRCHRLGRGRAYYDATLAALPPSTLRVGLAFEVQIVPAVPLEAHDQPLDAVITEARVILRDPEACAGGGPILV